MQIHFLNPTGFTNTVKQGFKPLALIIREGEGNKQKNHKINDKTPV
jgi:hypothetical protein